MSELLSHRQLILHLTCRHALHCPLYVQQCCCMYTEQHKHFSMTGHITLQQTLQFGQGIDISLNIPVA